MDAYIHIAEDIAVSTCRKQQCKFYYLGIKPVNNSILGAARGYLKINLLEVKLIVVMRLRLLMAGSCFGDTCYNAIKTAIGTRERMNI